MTDSPIFCLFQKLVCSGCEGRGGGGGAGGVYSQTSVGLEGMNASRVHVGKN